MQIHVKLLPKHLIHFDFNYYSQMAASVYHAISYVDPFFASELHDGKEYRNRIKLFGFSPLYSKKTEVHPENLDQNKAGGLIFKGPCSFRICSPLPELMNRFKKSFLKAEVFRIGSQTLFIRSAEFVSLPQFSRKMIWRLQSPASFVTSWSQRDKGVKQYVLPGISVAEKKSESLLLENLIHKWRRLKDARPDIAEAWLLDGGQDIKHEIEINDIMLKLLPFSDSKLVHSKRHFIKNAPVLSWITQVEITAPVAIQRLIWSCGLGEMNSMGFGVVEADQ